VAGVLAVAACSSFAPQSATATTTAGGVASAVTAVTPTTLTSLALAMTATYDDEHTTTIAYTLSDSSAAVSDVSVTYRNADAVPQLATLGTPNPTGLVAVGAALRAGVNTLETVRVTGTDLAVVTYHRDGSVDGLGSGTRHSIDFPALDVTLRPGLPTGDVLSRTQGLRLQWGVSSPPAVLSGYRIVVSPGGRTLTVPATAAAVGLQQRYTLTGLTNGVTYTVSITPLSPYGDGRTMVASGVPLMSTNIFGPGDVTGDRRADVVAHRPSGVVWNGEFAPEPVYLYPGSGTGGFARRYAPVTGTFFERVTPGGDSNDDGRADWFGQDRGALYPYSTTGPRLRLGTGWNTMRWVDGGSDLSGDGRTDILGVATNGELFLYRVDGRDHVLGRTKIGAGWSSMLAVFTPGDWSGDHKADVVAVDPSGVLWLYRGNGLGGFMGSRVQIGKGWAGFGAVLPLRDFNGDGRMDIGAVTMGGDLYLYAGNGVGGFLAPRRIGTGWNVFF
jgi:hypothetical protein